MEKVAHIATCLTALLEVQPSLNTCFFFFFFSCPGCNALSHTGMSEGAPAPSLVIKTAEIQICIELTALVWLQRV